MRQASGKSYKELYQDIRQQSRIEFRKGMLAGHFLTRDIGRLCSPWFIKHGIVPNQITVLMIIFGIIGSILFALPNVWCKIFGYLCWLMWFAMDCSDGQVARYTKTFSRYGTEMDYMAHLIDHPLMNIAIWATYIEMHKINYIIVSIVFLISISCELIMRNICAFEYYSRKLMNLPHEVKTASWIRYSWRQAFLYPTMIICFSWIIILDYWIDNGFSFYLYLVWLLFYFINFTKAVRLNLWGFYKQ